MNSSLSLPSIILLALSYSLSVPRIASGDLIRALDGCVEDAGIHSNLLREQKKEPTQKLDYGTRRPAEGGSLIAIDVSGIFSHNILGEIPPNETRTVNVGALLGNAGQPYRVVGIGWNVEIDAFVPSWLSDVGVALGDDPTYVNPDFVLLPGLGLDYPGLQRFNSNGIVDLTNIPGSGNVSFELSEGILSLEFFERYDDYGNGPAADALWSFGSSLTIQVTPVPEPVGFAAWFLGLFVTSFLRSRRYPEPNLT